MSLLVLKNLVPCKYWFYDDLVTCCTPAFNNSPKATANLIADGQCRRTTAAATTTTTTTTVPSNSTNTQYYYREIIVPNVSTVRRFVFWKLVVSVINVRRPCRYQARRVIGIIPLRHRCIHELRYRNF
jgi:hypothetical protein